MMHAPVLVLKDSLKCESGTKVHHANIQAAKAVADIIRITLGPRSMLKMLLDAGGGAMNLVDEDASSGSGDDVNILDGNKRQSGAPSSSGHRKRSCKDTGNAIVDAMLELAAASKMRAAAIMRNEDRFTINKCIEVLDDIQGVDERIYFLALDLFENPNARETFISLKSDKRLLWLKGKFGASSS